MKLNFNVLEVINPEAHFPVVFSYPIANGKTIEDGVDEFFKEIYQAPAKERNDIVHALNHNDVWWIDETYCFTLVPIAVE